MVYSFLHYPHYCHRVLCSVKIALSDNKDLQIFLQIYSQKTWQIEIYLFTITNISNAKISCGNAINILQEVLWFLAELQEKPKVFCPREFLQTIKTPISIVNQRGYYIYIPLYKYRNVVFFNLCWIIMLSENVRLHFLNSQMHD